MRSTRIASSLRTHLAQGCPDPATLYGRASSNGDPAPRLYHLAVDPDIDAAGRQIACKGHIAGADIASAIARPEFRRWKPGDVDLLAADSFSGASLTLK